MRVSMYERLWGVNVSVNEFFVFSFLSCDHQGCGVDGIGLFGLSEWGVGF